MSNRNTQLSLRQSCIEEYCVGATCYTYPLHGQIGTDLDKVEGSATSRKLWLVWRPERSGSKEPEIIIIGCDFHPGFQQIAVLDMESGECEQRKLMHATGEAEQFYRRLVALSLIGIESVGNSQWFVQLLEQLGHEVWIGDTALIRASYVRKQRTDKRDACHILELLVEDRFPRIWVPGGQQCVISGRCSFIVTSWCRYVRG